MDSSQINIPMVTHTSTQVYRKYVISYKCTRYKFRRLLNSEYGYSIIGLYKKENTISFFSLNVNV